MGVASTRPRRCERSSPSSTPSRPAGALATRVDPVSPPSPDADDQLENGPPFDPDRIVDALARHGVDYLMVGGMAAQLHGATRTTQDLDCLLQLADDNMER